MIPDAAAQADALELASRLAQVRSRAAASVARARELRQQAEQLRAAAGSSQFITADAWRHRRSSPRGRALLQRSQYARLLARLETMPVIEQAKGIIMAQSRCGEAEAFDLLRRVSQQRNVPVRDLAAQIVARTAGTAPPEPQRLAGSAVTLGAQAPAAAYSAERTSTSLSSLPHAAARGERLAARRAGSALADWPLARG
jgi:hypothetical protein